MSSSRPDSRHSKQPGRTGLASYLLIYGKGIAMGLGDSVPGVSGGTIAVITRIYDELIDSISSVDYSALRAVLTGNVKGAWVHINGNFLAVLALGILCGLLVSANTVLYLLEHHFQALMGFFIGLVLASCWLLRDQFQWGSLRNLLALAIGILVTAGIGLLPATEGVPGLPYLFFSGAIAICAMLLPGLSGAFILILLGSYETALRALIEFNVPIIAVFVAGCLLGLLSFSRLLGWLLHTYHQLSYSFIVGLLLGSLTVLWPWQQAVSFYVNREGVTEVLQTRNVLPMNFVELTGNNPALGVTLIAGLAGMALVLLLQRAFHGERS